MPTPIPARSVLIVGDSLTVGVSRLVGPLLAPGEHAIVDAKVGRRTQQGVDIVAAMTLAPSVPLIVALGTNDPDNAVVYAGEIDAMMRAAGDRPVAWLTVAASKPQINAALHAATSRWPNLIVADWEAVAAPHPEWSAGDGVHYNTAGYHARAQFVADLAERLMTGAGLGGPSSAPVSRF